jgi:hypothetical protein
LIIVDLLMLVNQSQFSTTARPNRCRDPMFICEQPGPDVYLRTALCR